MEAAKGLGEDGVLGSMANDDDRVITILQQLEAEETQKRSKLAPMPLSATALAEVVRASVDADGLLDPTAVSRSAQQSFSITTPTRRASFPITTTTRRASFSSPEAPSGPSNHLSIRHGIATSPLDSPAALGMTGLQAVVDDESVCSPALTSPGGGPPRPTSLPKAAAGVAYTAPELLSAKQKGKARAVEQGAEMKDRAQISAIAPHLIPLPPSPIQNEDFLETANEGGIYCETASQADSDLYLSPEARLPPHTVAPGTPDCIPFSDVFVPDTQLDPSLANNDPHTAGHDPLDDAYRDLSSGQMTPFTDSDHTLPASEESSPPDSPQIAAIGIGDPAIQLLHEPIMVMPDPAGPRMGRLRGNDVDVQFMADEDEDAHWEREDWDGVLEGTVSR